MNNGNKNAPCELRTQQRAVNKTSTKSIAPATAGVNGPRYAVCSICGKVWNIPINKRINRKYVCPHCYSSPN